MKDRKLETPDAYDLENTFSRITLNEVPCKAESEIEIKLSNLTLQEQPKVYKNYNLEKLRSCNLEGLSGVFDSDDEEDSDVQKKSLYRDLKVKQEIEKDVTWIPSESAEYKSREDCQDPQVLRKRGPIKSCSIPKHELSSPYGATSNLCTLISKPSRRWDNSNDSQLLFPGWEVLQTGQVQTIRENEHSFTSAENTEQLGNDDALPDDLEDIILERFDMAPPILDFSNLDTLLFQDSEISQTSPIAVPQNISPYPNDPISPLSDDTGYTSDLSDNRSCSNSPNTTLTTMIGRPKSTLPKLNINSVQKGKEFCNSLDNEKWQTSLVVVPHNINPYSEDQFSPRSDNTSHMSDNRYCSQSTTTLTIMIGKPRLILPKQNINSLSNERKSDTRNVQKRNKFYLTLDPKLCDKYQRSEKDKNFGEKNEKNRNILHEAIHTGDITKAVVLINILEKHFKNDNPKARRMGLSSFPDLPSYLNQRDCRGRTPLYTACVKNLTLVVENLLECGADLTLSEESTRNSIFHYFARQGIQDLRLLEVLCARSNDCLNLKNLKGCTPLHIAVQYHGSATDKLALIIFLLENRARLSSTDLYTQTPLHWVIYYNKLDLLTHMSNHGCDWDEAVNIQNYEGRTALHLAVIGKGIDYEDQKWVVRQLIVRNASTIILDSKGKFPKQLVPENKTDLIAILNEEWIQTFGCASGKDPICSA